MEDSFLSAKNPLRRSRYGDCKEQKKPKNPPAGPAEGHGTDPDLHSASLAVPDLHTLAVSDLHCKDEEGYILLKQ